ncbi:MAG: ribosome biogenesis GTP-binding protein YihA/YsxC [Candidatus Cloacimonadota bacterium]|nr:ribosome biogenesis GTP-binding protein YihA/YsxC [Candidatus Cloacimonadota bacterium]
MKIIDSNYHSSGFHFNQLPNLSFPEIAFIGRSNVGKSSMINALLNRKNLAQISKKPGKTRSINLFDVNYINNSGKRTKMFFADLPGYGFANVKGEMQNQWQKLVTNYIRNRRTLRGIVIIVDIRHEASPKDIDAIKWVSSFGKNMMIIATKSDKLSKSKTSAQIRKLNQQFDLDQNEIVHSFSAKNKFGKNIILNWIGEKVQSVES